jgi:hypothetical protein
LSAVYPYRCDCRGVSPERALCCQRWRCARPEICGCRGRRRTPVRLDPSGARRTPHKGGLSAAAPVSMGAVGGGSGGGHNAVTARPRHGHGAITALPRCGHSEDRRNRPSRPSPGQPTGTLCAADWGRQAPSSTTCGIPVIRVARERALELEVRVGSGPRTRVRVVDGSGPPGRQSETPAPLRAVDPATASRNSTVAVRPIGPMTWANDSDDRPRVHPARALSSATAPRKLGALLR